MILTLTPNPALDLTYEVDQARVHAEHRVRRVRSAPGGKGVNVARVLAQLGRPATCAGPLGGATGEQIRDLLRAHDGVRQAWTPIAGDSRRTVTVVAPDGATGFHEPGPALGPAEREALVAGLTALLSSASPLVTAVTLSGSLPPGLSGEDLAQLVGVCRRNDRPVLVDTSGPALLAAARSGADVLKPNAAEALEATGTHTPLEAALALLEIGAGAVVCSLGPEGMLGVRRDNGSAHGWRARLAEPIAGNPTGAGDSVVAVLAATVLVDGAELPEALRRAVAVSASAVTRPVAGEIDLQLADELMPAVEIQEIPCP
ncbi:1-phosphofructokinase family hexose kinase [Brachybacterium sp. FME24]|uniref:1-phosphofructokinase family hexose kinase n=1 Tax=Brachybacterium sp. FME24 TaxID=2742605 RepID=UPI00186632E7|nr:1-phosphofructokinase family hexose kinase [Brachybacterium sp. FME24]